MAPPNLFYFFSYVKKVRRKDEEEEKGRGGAKANKSRTRRLTWQAAIFMICAPTIVSSVRVETHIGLWQLPHTTIHLVIPLLGE